MRLCIIKTQKSAYLFLKERTIISLSTHKEGSMKYITILASLLISICTAQASTEATSLKVMIMDKDCSTSLGGQVIEKQLTNGFASIELASNEYLRVLAAEGHAEVGIYLNGNMPFPKPISYSSTEFIGTFSKMTSYLRDSEDRCLIVIIK